ncbi:MAG: endonuclease domain-containing protein [Bacteroidota bacterium]|jgi:very-short-patch-repair endonuclease
MPYPHHIIGVARNLRKNATATEKLLWEQLRDRRLAGIKFARQHPFGRYVVDFYCAELKLVIEIDGGVHNAPMQEQYDRLRSDELESWGLSVLRVSNEEVLHGMDKLLKGILDRRAKR